MSKVALHEYEKAVERRKWLNKVDTVLKWFCISIALCAPVTLLAIICIGLWVGGVGWLGPIIVTVLGGIGVFLYMDGKNKKILENAREYGTVDE